MNVITVDADSKVDPCLWKGTHDTISFMTFHARYQLKANFCDLIKISTQLLLQYQSGGLKMNYDIITWSSDLN